MQAVHAPLSSRHSNEATPEPPGSLPLKVNDALLLFDGFDGLLSMVVSGGVVSGGTVLITQVKPAGVGSVLPAASMARTWKVWLPSLRPL